MHERNSDIRFLGGVGMSGHVRRDWACHFPVNRIPGIFAPVMSARSDMVITWRNSRT
jgi:hypothetical protein